MVVRLSPAQRALVRRAIERGRFRREEDAVREALSLWEQLERTRAGILAAFDQAEAKDEAQALAEEDETKPRGRRIAAGQSFLP